MRTSATTSASSVPEPVPTALAAAPSAASRVRSFGVTAGASGSRTVRGVAVVVSRSAFLLCRTFACARALPPPVVSALAEDGVVCGALVDELAVGAGELVEDGAEPPPDVDEMLPEVEGPPPEPPETPPPPPELWSPPLLGTSSVY